MVAGFHLIWTAYGWWLPNDPRGSSSHEIRVEPIAELGEPHHGRKERQPSGKEIREFYQKASDVLKHPLLTFSDPEIELIGETFKEVINDRNYTCYGCAIMPDHVHILIRKHRDHAEDMVDNLHEASRAKLIEAGSRAPTHPVWGGPGWKRFLYTQQDFERVAEYIRQNPIMARRPEQIWPFVKKYDGWMPGRWKGSR
jgi:REP element-mobilizing transposase RayT